MTVKEILERITTLKHRIRVYSLLVDTLQPYLDKDLGTPQVLEADGCLVRYVPKNVIQEILDEELYTTLESHTDELEQLSKLKVEGK